MKLSSLKKMTMGAALGVVAILGLSETANAQYSNDRYRNREIRKQERRIEKQERKIDRQQQRIQQMRYRVYRNGGYYNTDQRGVQMLQQAVNYGYQQGFQAGQYDAQRRNRYGYNSQSQYRNGTYGYNQGYVDRSQYQYYFQQGFQKGYEDGYYRRSQYGNSGRSILGSILSNILNIQQY